MTSCPTPPVAPATSTTPLSDGASVEFRIGDAPAADSWLFRRNTFRFPSVFMIKLPLLLVSAFGAGSLVLVHFIALALLLRTLFAHVPVIAIRF